MVEAQFSLNVKTLSAEINLFLINYFHSLIDQLRSGIQCKGTVKEKNLIEMFNSVLQ